MNFRPSFAFLLLSLFCVTHTTQLFAANGYTIKARLSNAPVNTTFYIFGIDGSQSTPLDTLVTNEKGYAEAKGNVPDMGLAVLRNGANQILFVIENKTINFEFDFNNWMSYNITGSNSSEQLTKMIQTVRTKPTQAEQATYLNAYADTCKNAFIAYVAVSNVPIDQYYTTYEKVIKLLEKKIPNSRFTTELKTTVLKSMAAVNTAIGKVAPDLTLNSPDGKTYTLSNLRGKVVLVDFWASWCGPCRKENPNVVAAYDKYKNKGFAIYNVSLDKSVEPWKAAIEKDNLNWEYHVSDLGGWNSLAAATYAVGSIPQNFLLDKDGKIIAKNLRGEALEAKLAEILK